MYRFPPRRILQPREIRRAVMFVGCLILLDLWIALNQYKTFNRNLATSTVTHIEDLPPAARDQKIYVVAQFWWSADVLVDHWQAHLLSLIDILGAQNVYLSLLSSGSLDNTNEILHNLDENLLRSRNVPRTIITDSATHEDAINKGSMDVQGKDKEGWIYTSDSKESGQKELRRIPYLAELRNRSLEPLKTIHKETGFKYDKILYINDVFFQPSDVLSLLATNEGIYDVACGFDFHYTPLVYDTFALRDDQGDPAASRYFPFYRSPKSLQAVKRGLPVPVTSCWNGIVIADAAPYYDRERPLNSGPSGTELQKQQQQIMPGLSYRGISDSLATTHVEASECCLIHADLIARGEAKKGLFMNPAVRVGYGRDPQKYPTTAYQDVHTGPKGLGWVTANEYIFGTWKNRFVRWFRPAWWDFRNIKKSITKWIAEGNRIGEKRSEPGEYCLIDECQILIGNGWKKV